MQIVCRGMLCGEYDGLLQISQQAECMRLSRMDKFAAFFCLSISICLFLSIYINMPVFRMSAYRGLSVSSVRRTGSIR